MRLNPYECPEWPKLAWVARCGVGDPFVSVHHGPCVEVAEEWCAEAVWAGTFERGDFDRTDVVFGSGVRCRDGQVHFVSSGSTCDRLWYVCRDSEAYVSNSLPALLATSDTSLELDYGGYRADIYTIIGGLENLTRQIPGTPSEVRVQYFDNLVFDGRTVSESPKPDRSGPFDSYESYFHFLMSSAEELGRNSAAGGRSKPVVPITSISRGYDSPTAAVLARQAGCEMAVTFSRSRSLRGHDDSGKSIAQVLGMPCTEYDRSQMGFESEVFDWAAQGYLQAINLFAFDYPGPVSLFFTGFHGDKIWDRTAFDSSRSLVRGDSTGLGFCEYRLAQGILHCPVPFLGARRAAEIHAVSASDAMDPWSVGGDYDRPICRRILEELGVPREAFGMHKNATAVTDSLPWPRTAECKDSFRDYLRAHDVSLPWELPLRLAYSFDLNVLERVRAAFGIPFGYNTQYQPRGTSLLFHWANDTLKNRYARALPPRMDPRDRS